MCSLGNDKKVMLEKSVRLKLVLNFQNDGLSGTWLFISPNPVSFLKRSICSIMLKGYKSIGAA